MATCVPVMLCTVVIMPEAMPSCLWITEMTGAMQLVVHDAAVQITCSSLSLSSFTERASTNRVRS